MIQLPDNAMRFIRDNLKEKYPAIIQRHLVTYILPDGQYISTEEVREIMVEMSLENGTRIKDMSAKFPDARRLKADPLKTGRKKKNIQSL